MFSQEPGYLLFQEALDHFSGERYLEIKIWILSIIITIETVRASNSIQCINEQMDGWMDRWVDGGWEDGGWIVRTDDIFVDLYWYFQLT